MSVENLGSPSLVVKSSITSREEKMGKEDDKESINLLETAEIAAKYLAKASEKSLLMLYYHSLVLFLIHISIKIRIKNNFN